MVRCPAPVAGGSLQGHGAALPARPRYSARADHGNRSRRRSGGRQLPYHVPVTTQTPPPGYLPTWYAGSIGTPAPRPKLTHNHQADVVILGAGFTGLGAAISLARQGLQVVVLEAERVGWGASGRNGGQALVGFGCDQQVLEGLTDPQHARLLFDYSRQGLALLKQRIAEFNIDCQWHDGAADVAITARQASGLQQQAERMARLYDYPLQFWDRQRTGEEVDSPRFVAGLFDANAGHLHPLRYALGLARAAQQLGVRIYEHSPVRRISHPARGKVNLHTDLAHVSADYAVIAGNALLEGIAPRLEKRIMPVGTYVGATPPLGHARARALIANDIAVADVNWALDYFHLSADHRLLFGGMASYSALPPPGLQAAMTRRMHAVFPQLRDVALENVWGGMIDITRNRAPHFGRMAPNVYFAQGFCGHGVAATGMAGELIARAIAGQASGLDAFARIGHRPFPGGRLLRRPLLVAAMSWYKLRDRLG